MISDQIRTLEVYSRHLTQGFLADDIMTTLARAASNKELSDKDLNSLEKAVKYIDLIEKDWQITYLLPKEIRISPESPEQIYVDFATQKNISIRDIPSSISQMKYELERARKGDISDKEELQFTRDFFHYLLRYAISKMDELDYW